ncbi:hypothetical protein ACGFZR_24740 [Streptomyces sp. NPDC048241]|uniref:hypothetical protein n=1 Tax=Streptomyces sp. NPDC048241 TaxID=3365521 RepID=UPI003713141B
MSTHDDEADGPRPIGDLLNALGIAATVKEGELVGGAVVLLKVIDADGDVRLSLAHSDGLSWIERAGMVRIACSMEERSHTQHDGAP